MIKRVKGKGLQTKDDKKSQRGRDWRKEMNRGIWQWKQRADEEMRTNEEEDT